MGCFFNGPYMFISVIEQAEARILDRYFLALDLYLLRSMRSGTNM